MLNVLIASVHHSLNGTTQIFITVATKTLYLSNVNWLGIIVLFSMICIYCSKKYRVSVITCTLLYFTVFYIIALPSLVNREREEWRCRWKCTYLVKNLDVYFSLCFLIQNSRHIMASHREHFCSKCRETDTLWQNSGNNNCKKNDKNITQHFVWL